MQYAGGGVSYSVDPDAVTSASKDLQRLADDKASYRVSIAWPSVVEVKSSTVAGAVEEFDRAYRATWADFRDHLGALSDTGVRAAELYRKTDGQVVTDANAPSIYF